MTGVCLGFYWIFLRQKAFFQNIFNNRERWRVFNILRKVGATYGIFIGSVMMLNSHYQKKMGNGLNELGLFKKYRITYEEKFV
jgi:hypothetical protein